MDEEEVEKEEEVDEDEEVEQEVEEEDAGLGNRSGKVYVVGGVGMPVQCPTRTGL